VQNSSAHLLQSPSAPTEENLFIHLIQKPPSTYKT